MKIKVLFFGILAEKAGSSMLVVEDVKNFNELKLKIESGFLFLKTMKYIVAHNFKLIENNIDLKDGDEISFMPPFAGG